MPGVQESVGPRFLPYPFVGQSLAVLPNCSSNGGTWIRSGRGGIIAKQPAAALAKRADAFGTGTPAY